MTTLIAGYDLDGTICENCPAREKPYFKQNALERRSYEILRRYHYKNSKIIRFPQEEKFYIITGRKERYLGETLFLLKQANISPAGIYMLPNNFSKTRESITFHKIYWCKKLGIEIFYEDDKKIAKSMEGAGINVVIAGG